MPDEIPTRDSTPLEDDVSKIKSDLEQTSAEQKTGEVIAFNKEQLENILRQLRKREEDWNA